MEGWIKLHRCLAEKAIWQDSTPEQKTILITLLMMANHREKEWIWKGEKFKAKPGQFVTSIDSIAKKSGKGITKQNVRTALFKFEKLGFLTNESTKTGRLITLTNWDKYQLHTDVANNDTNKALTKNQQSVNKALTPNKNVKNDKNGKNVDDRAEDSESVQIVVKKYENNINPIITPTEYEGLLSWMDLVEPELIIWAIEQAVYQGVRRFSYLNKILIEMHKQGIITREQADAREKTRKNKGGNNGWGGMA